MPISILLVLLIISSLVTSAQVSDFIAVKKRNGLTIKNFFEGSRLDCQLNDGSYVEGPIAKIHHDTVYVNLYTTEKTVSFVGSYVVDTLNISVIPIYYKNIRRINVYNGRGSNRQKLGVLMMVAGAGYALLNIFNGAYLKQPITDSKNLRSLGIAVGVAGAGLLNNTLLTSSVYNSRRDRIVYINLGR